MRRAAVLFVAVVALGACGASRSNLAAKGQSSVVTEAPQNTTTPPAPTTTTAARQDIQISAKGFTQMPPDAIGDNWVTYAVVLYNPNSATDSQPWVASDVSLNITFTNAAGRVLDSESPTVSYVLPGQYAAATDDTVQAAGVTGMTVQADVGSWQQNSTPITASFTVSGVTTNPQQYGGDTTVGIVHSTFQQDYKEVEANAVYENASGAIIGGAFAFVNFVPSGGQASFSISGTNTLPGIAKTVVYPSLTSLSTLSS